MEETKEVKQEKKSLFWDVIAPVIFTLFIVVGICFSALTLFEKRYFGRFFVNGQSMYPTLNLEAKNKDGVLYGKDYKPLRSGSYDIDYGIYDYHEQVMKKLERFDIVICRYNYGDSSDKIKRIIVLPGETFYLTRTEKDDEGNGLLYIKNEATQEFELVEQPIDDYYIHDGEYPVEYADIENPTTLGDNEYFVMGDNRGGSNDSRINGPISRDLIEGKVIALIAKCSIAYDNSSGQFYPDVINYYWPRFF